jgi:MFS family permease
MNRSNLAQRHLRSAVALLLQTNRPVPPRSEAEIAAEVERNYRWNFVVNLLDGAFFFLGLSFISSSTIAPLFVSKLTTSPLAIALVAIIAQAGWFLPQLLTANAVERLPRRKPVIVNLGFFMERLPLWMLVAAALVAVERPTLALFLFLGGIAWFTVGGGMVATAWQDLVARCFPVQQRGRFLGITSFVGTGMGALGAALTIWLLSNFPFSTNFVITFTIGAIAFLLSWAALALVREPALPVDTVPQSNRQFLAKLPGIVRQDGNYRRFLAARSLMALGTLGMGFVTVAALTRWQVPDSTAGVYTAALLLGQAAGNLTSGFLADRFGHKLCLEMGALAAALAFALAWLAPAPGWYYVVFFLLGINQGTIFVSGILVVLEFCQPQRRPTYAGLANTIVGLFSVVGPLLGAWLASMSYDLLFALCAITNLAALVALRWWVREPRWKTATNSPIPDS